MPLGMNSGSSECVLRATSDQPSTRVCSERVGGRFLSVGETHRSSVLPGLCVGGLHPPYNRQTRLSVQTLSPCKRESGGDALRSAQEAPLLAPKGPKQSSPGQRPGSTGNSP